MISHVRPKFVGVVKLVKREYDPTLVEVPGSIVEERTLYNKETNFMLNACAKWLSGSATTATLPPPTQIGAGNGSPPYGQSNVLATDTSLWSPIASTQRACDSITIAQTYYAQYNLLYQTTDPAGYYNELGLFDSNGNMWAHVMINDYKSSSQTLSVQWMVYMVNDTSNSQATVTNFMRSAFVQWLTGTSSTNLPSPTQIQLGTGSKTISTSITALSTPTSNTTKNCDFSIVIQNTSVQFAHTYQNADPTGNFTEMGWVDTAGNVWLYALISANKQSPNLLSIVGQVGIVGD